MRQGLQINLNNIFLVDAIGAALSAVFLGTLLPILRDWIGMPLPALYSLSLGALALAIFSACNHWLKPLPGPKALTVVIAGNLVYCCITGVLVAHFFDRMKSLGVLYFVLKTAVIIALVKIEMQIFSQQASINSDKKVY